MAAPEQRAKDAVDQFLAEGGYRLGGPEPRASEAEIAAVIDELSARLDEALPAGTELERAMAKIDAYEYFMNRLIAESEGDDL